jgi:hypothetical protein
MDPCPRSCICIAICICIFLSTYHTATAIDYEHSSAKVAYKATLRSSVGVGSCTARAPGEFTAPTYTIGTKGFSSACRGRTRTRLQHWY